MTLVVANCCEDDVGEKAEGVQRRKDEFAAVKQVNDLLALEMDGDVGHHEEWHGEDTLQCGSS